MKLTKIFILVLALALFAVVPAAAQLGDSDVSSFTVQNISDGPADVLVTFISETGVEYQPTQLNASGSIVNPFTLQPGASQLVFVPNIPSAQLPSGRYAIVISSNAQVVAQAGVAGTGSLRFTGSYVGFSGGANTIYFPTVVFNSFGWYSMLTVQNVGDVMTDIDVTITCADGTIGTLSASDVPANASYTWAFKNVTPAGFTTATSCEGSAEVTADQPIAGVNNQNKPSSGATNTFEGAFAGAPKLFVNAASNNYFGWNSSLTVRKMGAGNTTVTIDYGGDWPNDTCNLTDAAPFCKIYIPSSQPTTGRYGAVITSSNGMNLLAVVGTTRNDFRGSFSGGVSGVAEGTSIVAIPVVNKASFGWNSAITCQNVSSTATTLNISYAGYEASAYNTATLNEGDSLQVVVSNEGFLPAGFSNGATVTANAGGAEIACMVGNTNNSGAYLGDWNSQYNAPGK